MSSVLAEIGAATSEVRAVAQRDDDAARLAVADWLDDLFSTVTTRAELRAAARETRELWAGWGSFADVGSAEQAHAVDRLHAALRRARSWRVRQG